MGHKYHYLRKWVRGPVCCHEAPQGYGGGSGRRLWTGEHWAGPGSHQIVQLRVGGEEGPLGTDLGGRERPERASPASSPPLLPSPGAEPMGAPTCLAKAAMSSLKESEEHTSPPGGMPSPVPAPSRGEHVASSHFSKTRASSGKSGCLGEAGEEVHEGRGGHGDRGVWSTWERAGDSAGEMERPRQRAKESERREKGPASREPAPLTRRSRSSPSSGHHCPSLGAGVGQAGVGHRARGLSVPRALPPRSQPGLQCRPRCLGSEAAHRTGGRREGESPTEVSGNLPVLAPRRCLSLPPGTRPFIPCV